eukprot:TRINITY_DN441_c0_g4_i1.p2 TRINITY_DN441_c0_g4~~TRINITY_DN441_c0_g4_i1.p2  ORF type:complete len:318 (+),score=15.18 TRINITY_DN441_c0_g4_i1:112-1065(+)
MYVKIKLQTVEYLVRFEHRNVALSQKFRCPNIIGEILFILESFKQMESCCFGAQLVKFRRSRHRQHRHFRSVRYCKESQGWGQPNIVSDWGGDKKQAKTERVNSGNSANSNQSSTQNGFDQTQNRNKNRKLNITVLNEYEKNEIIPLIPTGQQSEYYSSQRTIGWIPIVASIFLGLWTSQAPAVSLPLITWPLWLSWVRAGIRNNNLINNVKSMGLWRTQLETIKNGKNGIQLVLQDTNGGCKTSVTVPYDPRIGDLQEGDEAEVIVVSQSKYFTKFQVVREVYIPALELWLGEYPFVNRRLFLRISLDIYRASFTQ